jgi:O-methyltransferase domain
MQNPINTVLELSMVYAVPRCLHAIADLGVADALDDSPRTAGELAASTGTDAHVLARALRLVSAHGIFEARDGGYIHTPASRLLRTDHPQSLRSFVRMIGFPAYWRCFEPLTESIRTGESPSQKVIPGDMWAYLAEHPEQSQIFNEAMTGKAHAQIVGILSNYDFSSFKSIADIGGGHGHLLQAILNATPQVSGVLFDLSHVVEHAAARVSDRLQVQAGDFFKDSLPVCDAYTIMQVIHDWSDTEALKILKAIRRAAPAHAKLLLIEAIVPEDAQPSWIKMLDLFMFALLTGKERTLPEFRAILAASGFHLDKVIDVGLGMSILESSAI